MAILLAAAVVLAVGVGPLTGTAAAAPTLQSRPTITHNAWVLQTLTLTQGTYGGSPTVSDLWYVCSDSAGTMCRSTAIRGTTYAVGSGDVGSYIKVIETATDSSLPPTATTTDSNISFQVAAQAPSSRTAPTISDTTSGTATITEGDTLSVGADGTWTEPPDYITRQWMQCDAAGASCTAIVNATAGTYVTGLSDLGHTLKVQETPHYAPNDLNNVAAGAVAPSAPTGLVQTTSTVSLTASPSTLVTNQVTTLTATVKSATAGVAPAGSVQFADQGKPIGDCTAVPVQPTGQSVTVACQASFAPESAQLTATYTPGAGSAVLGSSSPTQTLTVGRGGTTTAVDVSPQVQVHDTTTYTATVAAASAPGGPIQPTGTVQFLDGGKPIAGCTGQRLVSGGATCTARYSATGSRSIVAQYQGDSNFFGSSAPARAVTVTALAAHGAIISTMQWTFAFAPSYTRVINMVINGVPTGATVQMQCRGRGCPFAKRTTTIGKPQRCTGKRRRTHSCPIHGRISLTATFRSRNLHPGAQITIEIRRPQFVGKYYSFTVRSRKQPRVQIGCLAVDGTRPDLGC